MKIELEKSLLAIFFIALIFTSIWLVSPVSDNYLHYTIARQILRDPEFLWRSNMTAGTSFIVSTETPVFNYSPLMHLFYAFLFLLGIAPKLLDILSIILVGYFLYKIEKKAISFIFLSFLFIRVAVFGGIDIFLTALILASIYFFDKKPEVSGIFAGLTILVKGPAFLFFGGWIISILLFKRKEIFQKKFYKNKFFIAIFLSILVASSWYLRNFILFKGDIMATLIGFKSSDVMKTEKWLESGVQAQQPERYWWDSSGFYPLPIDLLFYIGIIFTAYNIVKTKKVENYHIFIILFTLTYFTSQIFSINFIMTIRYYLPIFPLLAIQIARGFPDKYLKFAYLGCLVLLMFFIFNLPKYAFNQLDNAIGSVCMQIKDKIDFEPVYVNAFHNWYVTYKCDLNATTKEDSKWTLDFDQGNLYLTNKTNLTGV